MPKTHAWIGFLLATATAFAAEDRRPVLPRIPGDAEQQTAKERAAIRPGRVYKSGVPTPESVLGYEIGTAHTDHRGVQAYLRALATAAPSRVILRDYATSYEGRTLSYVVITSEENVAALDKRRSALAKISDPRGRSGDELDGALSEARPIVWVGASVHGDEHSSTEAVLALAYHLAACEDEDVRGLRDRTIVVIDPLQNPDGRERWIGFQQMLALSRTSGDRNGVEHDEVWPSGRSNHYLFDMNRDLSFLTQPETRGRLTELVSWMPQVVVDLHEFSGESSYFFPPCNEPQNKNVPESLRKLFVEFGKANAEAFDARGYDYYVRDTFDFLYPGYGDMLPAMMGAVGMTFEQASPGGLLLRRDDGQLLTLTAATAHHFTASLSTCRTAARLGPDLLRSYLDYRRTAVEEGASGDVKQFLFDATKNPVGLRGLVDKLSIMGVEMRRLTKAAKIRARDLVSGEDATRDFAAGTIVVPLDQPQKRLIVSLLERDAVVDASFVLEERERFRARQPLRYYDLTAWSLPIAAGVPAYASSVRVASDSVEKLCAGSPVTTVPDCLRRNVATAVPPARYGWLLRYDGADAVRAAAALLDAGVVVRVAGKKFRLGDETFERGTLVVRGNENAGKADLIEVLARVARESDLRVTPVDSSWTSDGISLGSDDVARVRKPRIAVLWGEPAYSTSAGWIAWILDQRYGVPFTWIFPSTMTGKALKEYDVVVLPDMSGSGSELPIETLKTWVGNGGVLVAIGGAASALAKPDLKMTTVELVQDLRKLHVSLAEDGPASATATGAREEAATPPATGRKGEPAAKTKSPQTTAADEPDKKKDDKDEKDEKEPIPREARVQETPGAIFRVTLDPDSFLTFGYGADLDVLVSSSRVMTPSKEGTTVARYTAKPLVSGFAWQRMQRALAGQAYLVQEDIGSGHLVLFAEDPNFRAGWEVTERLFLNALLFGPSL